jgi:hypothetical protein
MADLGEKEAVLAAQPGAFFTIPHLDGYPAVLIQLKNVSRAACEKRSSTAGSHVRRPASWASTSGAERGNCGRSLGPSARIPIWTRRVTQLAEPCSADAPKPWPTGVLR